MPKLTLDSLASLENQTSAIQVINENNERIEAALENTLSRDGQTPNTLSSPLDLNGQRGINVGTPITATDAARLIDVQNALTPEGVLVPSLVGNEDKLLSNDGLVLVWAEPSEIAGLGDLVSTNNLSDLDNLAAARTNLGLGTAATQNTGTSGAVFGLLSTNNTTSGNNVHSGTELFNGAVTLDGTGNHRVTTTSTVLTADSVGYRGLPLNAQDSAYVLVLGDFGKMIHHTSSTAHAWTVPPNNAVAFPIGTAIVVSNVGTGVVTLTRGASVVLRIAGSGTSADVALAQYGFATLVKLDTNTWVVSGTGLS